MAANSVSALTGSTDQTVKEAVAWISMMGDRGVYQPNTARFRIGAIESLTSVLGPEEPRRAQWVLDNIHEIAMRWATLNSSKPETTTTYESRAKGGLEDYLDYIKDPTKKVKSRRKEAVAPTPAKKFSKTKSKVADNIASSSTETQSTSTGGLRSFPVTTGDFLHQLPSEGVIVKDVFKIMCHLLTFAKDFDPTNTVQARFFALARGED